VRNARGGKGKTRAWDGVKTKDLEVRSSVQVYEHARAALHRMGLGARWQPIKKEDLAMPGDITEANRTGQRSSTLPWFWRLDDGSAIDKIEGSNVMGEVYRVNWLRAKARVARWMEETNIVENEMRWTINSFKNLAQKWTNEEKKAADRQERGLQSYSGGAI
ncbi:hypothetical protein R3P38DRAFT_2590966, partial [Favolaschia claudopus]